jgi:hypothetical protein
MTAEGAHRALPNQRDKYADQISKATVLAEARLIVARLDKYLELIDSWYAEEEEEGGEDAGQREDNTGDQGTE